MANINNLKIGEDTPSRIMFDKVYQPNENWYYPSNIECWNAFLGDKQVYCKEKTFNNCIENNPFGIVEVETFTDVNNHTQTLYSVTFDNTVDSGKGVFPELTDLEEHFFNRTTGKPLLWNYNIYNSSTIYSRLWNYISSNSIMCGTDTNSDVCLLQNKWLNGAGITNNITDQQWKFTLELYDGVDTYIGDCFGGNYFNDFCIALHFNSGGWISNAQEFFKDLTVDNFSCKLQVGSSEEAEAGIAVDGVVTVPETGRMNTPFEGINCKGMFQNFTIKGDDRKVRSIIYFPQSGEDCDVSYMFDGTDMDIYGDSTLISGIPIDLIMSVYPTSITKFLNNEHMTGFHNSVRLDYIDFTQCNGDESINGYQAFNAPNMETLYLYKVHGSYFNVADSNEHGYLPKLSSDCIKALFDNAEDLKYYDSTYTARRSFTYKENDEYTTVLNINQSAYSGCSDEYKEKYASSSYGRTHEAMYSFRLYTGNEQSTTAWFTTPSAGSISVFFQVEDFTCDGLRGDTGVSNLQDVEITLKYGSNTKTIKGSERTGFTIPANTTVYLPYSNFTANDVYQPYFSSGCLYVTTSVTLTGPYNLNQVLGDMYVPSEWEDTIGSDTMEYYKTELAEKNWDIHLT